MTEKKSDVPQRVSLPALKPDELTPQIVVDYICPTATKQEVNMFLQLCKSQQLNPFMREVYLIKYGSQAASIVVGKEAFLKRADRVGQKSNMYGGFKAGIIVNHENKVQYRDGSFIMKGEELLGGWCEVIRRDRDVPLRIEVALHEYEQRKGDGTLNKNWSHETGRPATMIRKVAVVQAHREAFPDEFAGMYFEEEMGVDLSQAQAYEVGKHPGVGPSGLRPPKSIDEPAQDIEAEYETVETPDAPAPEPEEEGLVSEPQKESAPPDEEPKLSEPQRKKIWAMLHGLGIDTDDKKRERVSELIGRPIESMHGLTKKEASQVISALNDSAQSDETPF